MWLIVSSVAAVAVTALWAFTPKKYKLGSLAIMLWGLSLMIFVDHALGYEGGPFIEMETDGLIESGTVLGIAMIMPLFIIWEIQLVISKMRGELNTR
ncbi:MAG: hypothetical protein GF414_07860 [Candidatus Altiarchaeales archaeon]|nr:hypothetical protein [Candidatus Altiarchaeales archaeon]